MSQEIRGLGIIILLICTYSFTAYQTYQGYLFAMGFGPAFVLASLCGILLFWLSYTLHNRLKDNSKTWGLWIGCLIVTLVSMPGNFNAFYTGFVRGELVKEELEQKRNNLDELYNKSQKVLADKAFSSLESEVNALKQQLRSQIMNEGNPGLGDAAQSVIARLNAKLNDTLTPLVAAGRDAAALKKLADRYDENIDSKLNAKRVMMVENAEGRKAAEIENLQAYTHAMKLINNALEVFALDKGSTAQAEVIHAIQQSVKAYSSIGAVTRSNLADGVVFEYDKNITLMSDKVGTIDFSLNSALGHLTHFATWLSLFLAFFIDMGVPLTMRLIVKSDRDNSGQNNDSGDSHSNLINNSNKNAPMVLE